MIHTIRGVLRLTFLNLTFCLITSSNGSNAKAELLGYSTITCLLFYTECCCSSMSGVSTAGSLAKDHGLSFPPEIINEIIANLDLNGMKYTELAFTWCATRRVSKQFFNEITRNFGQKVLPEMTVSYFLGMYPQGKDGACPPHEIYTTEADTQRDRCKGLSIGSINMSLKFDHSSEDGVVAFFNAYRLGSEASPRTGPHKDHQINFFRTLELCRTAEPDFAKGLRQLIHLRGVFQDMALPCFAVDKEKLEMGFNWKDLFSAMFKEEMQVDSAIDIHDVRIHFNACEINSSATH